MKGCFKGLFEGILKAFEAVFKAPKQHGKGWARWTPYAFLRPFLAFLSFFQSHIGGSYPIFEAVLYCVASRDADLVRVRRRWHGCVHCQWQFKRFMPSLWTSRITTWAPRIRLRFQKGKAPLGIPSIPKRLEKANVSQDTGLNIRWSHGAF